MRLVQFSAIFWPSADGEKGGTKRARGGALAGWRGRRRWWRIVAENGARKEIHVLLVRLLVGRYEGIRFPPLRHSAREPLQSSRGLLRKGVNRQQDRKPHQKSALEGDQKRDNERGNRERALWARKKRGDDTQNDHEGGDFEESHRAVPCAGDVSR
ncbi:MAG: hypothetical protein ACP5M5_02855 [Acidibrevibacterium sp.]|uniref:hypothetical protein n=1 Tax=Acidibrevibacterium sp. TaxID=2606776 RepID=UPI003D008693